MNEATLCVRDNGVLVIADQRHEPIGPVRQLTSATSVGSVAERTEAALKLSDSVGKLGRKRPDSSAPRLKPLQEARLKLQEVHTAENDPSVKAAFAMALSSIHRELHALIIPDPLARSAVVKYRESHPAANAAAEAIIIYPTNRTGAPGLTP